MMTKHGNLIEIIVGEERGAGGVVRALLQRLRQVRLGPGGCCDQSCSYCHCHDILFIFLMKDYSSQA